LLSTITISLVKIIVIDINNWFLTSWNTNFTNQKYNYY